MDVNGWSDLCTQTPTRRDGAVPVEYDEECSTWMFISSKGTGSLERMSNESSKLKSAVPGLVLLFAVIYLLPLNLRQLSVPDEMRYGEIAREMNSTGDYVSPHLNGLRYFEKPAGGHVLNAVSMKLFGETNFSVRLMSALAAGIAACALYRLMRKHYPFEAAATGALILLTCGEFMAIGSYGALDSMVSVFITLTLVCFYPALDSAGMKRIGWLALTGVFAGSAFLVKGFIAFAVPVLVIVPFLLIQKRWKDLFVLPWIPLIAAIAVSLPWSLAVAHREPDFWRYFFWEEHIHRFFSQEDAEHAAPFWYYVPVFLAGAIPWILVAPGPLREMLRSRRGEPMIRYALCWAIAPFLFFSASSGKLGTYILPCFPPFALLLAVGLTDRFRNHDGDRSMRIGISIFGGILALVLLALPIIAILNAMEKLPELDPHIGLKLICGGAGLLLALALVVTGLRSGSLYRRTSLLGISSAVFFVTVIGCLPTEISPSLGLQGFLVSEQRHVEPDTIVVGDPKTTHAMCYVYKRDDIYLFSRMSEFDYGLSYPEARHRYLELADLQSLIRNRAGKRVVVAIKARPTDTIQTELPTPSYQRQWLKIWFAVYEPQSNL